MLINFEYIALNSLCPQVAQDSKELNTTLNVTRGTSNNAEQ